MLRCVVPVSLVLPFLLCLPAASDASGQQTDRERLRQLQSLPYVSPPGQPTDNQCTGVVGFRSESVAPGVTFYSSRFTNRAFLMTNDGTILHEWSVKGLKSSWLDAEVLPDGSLITLNGWDAKRAPEFPDEKGFPAWIDKLAPDSSLVWRREHDAHHEIHLLDGGNVLTLLQASRSVPAVSRRQPVMDNLLAILSPTGAVLETRSVYDILKRVRKKLPLRPSDAVVGDAIDLFHTNSAQWVDDDLARRIKSARGSRTQRLHAAGTVIFCMRHQDAVVAMNWKTGEVLWTWGRGEVQGPHAATVLPNGNVLVFDNGLERLASRVVEVDPATNAIVWQYAARDPRSFYTGTGGYAQRLPNGNTLLTSSWAYQAFEVTPDKRLVWIWINPERSFTYRVSGASGRTSRPPSPPTSGARPWRSRNGRRRNVTPKTTA